MGHGKDRDAEGKTLRMGRTRSTKSRTHPEWDAQRVEYGVGYAYGTEYKVGHSQGVDKTKIEKEWNIRGLE